MSTRKSYFAKQVSVKVKCIFLHKITGLAQNLPINKNQPFYQDEIKHMGFFPFFSFQFHFDQITSTKVTEVLPDNHFSDPLVILNEDRILSNNKKKGFCGKCQKLI